MTVNRAVAQKWVDALRSGEYQQTIGKLGRVDEATGERSYCCLGVLCEVAVADEVIPPAVVTDEDNLEYDSCLGTPSGKVAEYLWPGSLLTDEDTWDVGTPRELSGYTGHVGLTTLNDTHGYTFNQIADAIEATHLATVPA